MGNASGGSEQGASPGSNVPNNLGNTRTDMEDQIEVIIDCFDATVDGVLQRPLWVSDVANHKVSCNGCDGAVLVAHGKFRCWCSMNV